MNIELLFKRVSVLLLNEIPLVHAVGRTDCNMILRGITNAAGRECV